jgi:TonB family protein
MQGWQLESGFRRTRSVRGSIVSLSVHGAIVLLAVRATDAVARPAPKSPTMVSVSAPRAPAPVVTRTPSHASSRGPAGPTLAAPTIVPVGIPPVNDAIGRLLDDMPDRTPILGSGDPAADFGSAADALTATPSVSPGDSIDNSLLPASLAPGSRSPVYPEALRSRGVRGAVTVEFIIDTLGRAERASVVVRTSDDPAFTTAVQDALPVMRFVPARTGDGRRVRQRVAQTFEFRVQ